MATLVGTGGGAVTAGPVGQQQQKRAQTGPRLPDHDLEHVTKLAYGQGRGFFLSPRCCCIRKKWASIQRVMCRCQPAQLRPS